MGAMKLLQRIRCWCVNWSLLSIPYIKGAFVLSSKKREGAKNIPIWIWLWLDGGIRDQPTSQVDTHAFSVASKQNNKQWKSSCCCFIRIIGLCSDEGIRSRGRWCDCSEFKQNSVYVDYKIYEPLLSLSSHICNHSWITVWYKKNRCEVFDILSR